MPRSPNSGRQRIPNSPGPLLRQQIRGRFEVLDGDRAPVRRLAVGPRWPDDCMGDEARGIRLWDLPTGTRRTLVSENSKHIQHLVFSPDGRCIRRMRRSDSARDIPLGRRVRPPRGTLALSAHRAVSALLFSRDGRRLAALDGRRGAGVRAVEYWDVRAAVGAFPILSPEQMTRRSIADMADARLRSLADLMDDRQPGLVRFSPGAQAILGRACAPRHRADTRSDDRVDWPTAMELLKSIICGAAFV